MAQIDQLDKEFFSVLDKNKFVRLSTSNTAVRVIDINAGVPYEWDSISIGYTSGNPTIVAYFYGGLSGSIVSTLSVSYSGADPIYVQRS